MIQYFTVKIRNNIQFEIITEKISKDENNIHLKLKNYFFKHILT